MHLHILACPRLLCYETFKYLHISESYVTKLFEFFACFGLLSFHIFTCSYLLHYKTYIWVYSLLVSCTSLVTPVDQTSASVDVNVFRLYQLLCYLHITGKYESHTRVHTREKPFQCDVCLQRYSTKSNLTVHKKKHTADAPVQRKDHKCPFCNKLHASRKTLGKHVKRWVWGVLYHFVLWIKCPKIKTSEVGKYWTRLSYVSIKK